MDKYLIEEKGNGDEYYGSEKRKNMRFPVSLAVKYSEDEVILYESFVFNISRGGVFIKTTCPLPKGSTIVMHVYIPPDSMLLGKFKGKVMAINMGSHDHPPGMHIKFRPLQSNTLSRLEEFLEERRHLLDIRA